MGDRINFDSIKVEPAWNTATIEMPPIMNVLSETCSNTSQDTSKTLQTCVYLLLIMMLVGEFYKTSQTPSHPNYK